MAAVLPRHNNLFARYKLKRSSEAPPADQSECRVCWREFDVAEVDDEDPPCQALETPCGHVIGSNCANKIIHKGMNLTCPVCIRRIPRCEKLYAEKLLYNVIERQPFAWNVDNVRWLFGLDAKLQRAVAGDMDIIDALQIFHGLYVGGVLTSVLVALCCYAMEPTDVENWYVKQIAGLSIPVIDAILMMFVLTVQVMTQGFVERNSTKLFLHTTKMVLMSRVFCKLSVLYTDGLDLIPQALTAIFIMYTVLVGVFILCSWLKL